MMEKGMEIEGGWEIEVDLEKEVKNVVEKGGLLKKEGGEVEKVVMKKNGEEGVRGGGRVWKVREGMRGFGREEEGEGWGEVDEIWGEVMKGVKIN